MQLKTSSAEFAKYGSVYDHPLGIDSQGYISRDWMVYAEQQVTKLFRFECEVHLEVEQGLAMLLVSEQPAASEIREFAIHRKVRLRKGVYFTVVAVSASVKCRLIIDGAYESSNALLDPPYVFERILPSVTVKHILGYYYSVRGNEYRFAGETHRYFELTYVDRGSMQTEIDGKPYVIGENELLLYGPGQFHTQRVIEGEQGGSCSYVTIVFDTDNQDCAQLLNRVFSCNKKVYTLLKTFVLESTNQLPYTNSLLLCLLQETLIRLLQSTYLDKTIEKPASDVRQHYQDELLEKIISYIDQTICQPITIAELCRRFSLSRSSLQLLFKENLDQSPKKYISEQKLEKSRQMICEGKHNISEIALMMGFSSIHYFSRAFTQHFQMSPSEYAKAIFKT